MKEISPNTEALSADVESLYQHGKPQKDNDLGVIALI